MQLRILELSERRGESFNETLRYLVNKGLQLYSMVETQMREEQLKKLEKEK